MDNYKSLREKETMAYKKWFNFESKALNKCF